MFGVRTKWIIPPENKRHLSIYKYSFLQYRFQFSHKVSLG